MAGLYLHIPFCRAKCIYCDFYSETETHLLPAFLSALTREIDAYRNHPAFSKLTFDTVYFGGGTPSLLAPEQVGGILQHLAQVFRFHEAPELSLEANPGTAPVERLAGYRTAGVNRLTLGVQSFDDEELRTLSRIHSSTEAVDAVEHARAVGFDNIGLDLIFGIPGQTPSSWRATLSQALRLAPEHLSIYGLTYEPNTPLWRQWQQGQIQRCAEEREREYFLLAAELLTAAGYEHYEISNYALPGKRSKHNQHYWDHSAYLGLGPSAHSFDGRRRLWNVPSLTGYIDAVERGAGAVAGSEDLTLSMRRTETLLLGLRRSDGVDLASWQSVYGFDLLPIAQDLAVTFGIENRAPFAASAGSALLAYDGRRLGLTLDGVLLYDSICKVFVDRFDR